MDKDKVMEEMKNRGYTVIDDNHIIMFTGKYPYIEDMEKEITGIIAEIGYTGSWGVRGVSKKRKSTRPQVKTDENETPAPVDETTLTTDGQMSLSDFMVG